MPSRRSARQHQSHTSTDQTLSQIKYLTEVTSTVAGDIDLLGILGIGDGVRNGFEQIKVSFNLKGDDPAKLRQIVEQSKARSAVYDVITNGVPVAIEVEAG